MDILEKQGLLEHNYFETQPVKQTLKFFRGFAQMPAENISDINRKRLLTLMETFVRSDFASQEIQPTMWLSVIDFTAKVGLDELSDYSRAMFYDTFEWNDLETTSVNSAKAKAESD